MPCFRFYQVYALDANSKLCCVGTYPSDPRTLHPSFINNQHRSLLLPLLDLVAEPCPQLASQELPKSVAPILVHTPFNHDLSPLRRSNQRLEAFPIFRFDLHAQRHKHEECDKQADLQHLNVLRRSQLLQMNSEMIREI